MLFELPKITPGDDAKSIQNVSFQFWQTINVLKSLNLTPIGKDPILCYLILSKPDENMLRAWENSSNSRELPKGEDILNFLQTQSQLGQSVDYRLRKGSSVREKCHFKGVQRNRIARGYKSSRSFVSTAMKAQFKQEKAKTSPNLVCHYFKECHPIYKCNKFLTLTVPERVNVVETLKVWKICFNKNHETDKCARGKCYTCNKNHNVLLHIDNSTACNLPQTI